MTARQKAFEGLRVLFNEAIRASDRHPDQTEEQQDAVAKVIAEQFSRVMNQYDQERGYEIYWGTHKN